jgi:ribosomal protein S21
VNNDLAYALRAFKRDTFREKDLAVMKEVAAEEANKDFISAYKKVQEKSSSKTSVKRDDTVDSKDQYGRSIKKTATGGTIIEFG